MSRRAADAGKPPKQPHLWGAHGLSEFVPILTEYRFHPVRKWRFDHAIPELALAVEVDGGCFVSGRHSRGASQIADHEKLNAAALLGWRVLHVTPRQLRTGYAERLLLAVIERDAHFVERPPELDSAKRRAKASLAPCKAPNDASKPLSMGRGREGSK